MAQRGRPSITKRQKELSRLQRQQEKAARRARRKQDRLDHPEGAPRQDPQEQPAVEGDAPKPDDPQQGPAQ